MPSCSDCPLVGALRELTEALREQEGQTGRNAPRCQTGAYHAARHVNVKRLRLARTAAALVLDLVKKKERQVVKI